LTIYTGHRYNVISSQRMPVWRAIAISPAPSLHECRTSHTVRQPQHANRTLIFLQAPAHSLSQPCAWIQFRTVRCHPPKLPPFAAARISGVAKHRNGI